MKKFLNYKNLIIIFTFSIIILTSSLYFSLITYYYADNLFTRFVHDISSDRNFFEILIQKYNIYGLPFIPFNPNLNILSYFNYDLKSPTGYLVYFFLLRVLELSTFLLYIYYFTKKKIPTVSLIIYLLFIFQFNVFDHQSYVNFPIIIFNFGLVLCLLLNKNLKIFTFIFLLSNFFSFFINPSYFVVTCFGPFLIYICFLVYEKKYKILFLSLILNLPFTLMYVFLSLGTARFAFGNLIKTENNPAYNFNIFESKLYLLILIIIFLYLIISLFQKNTKKFLTKDFIIFIFITILTLIFGILSKIEFFIPGIPHFIYIDYSIQFFYLAVITSFFLKVDARSKIFFNILFISLIIYKAFDHRFLILNYKKLVKNNSPLIENTKFINRYVWQTNEKFIFSEKYQNKRFLIDLPTEGSDYKNKICNKSLIIDNCKKRIGKIYNKIFNHSFLWHEYQKSGIVVNLGHSLMKGINTSAFFYPTINNKTRIPKNSILRTSPNFPINKNHNYDYILSDQILEYNLVEKVEYDIFNLFIYEYPKNKFRKILNTNEILSNTNYQKDIEKFDNNLFISSDLFSSTDFKNIDNFCDFKYIIVDTKYPNYLIKSKNNGKCFFVFPIPYSKTNIFYLNQKELKTYRSQYFFHGTILRDGDLITHKKKNIILYSFYSLIDYIDFRKFNE